MANISGTFTLDLCGKPRELKCNFGVIERLEEFVLKRPIISVLNEAGSGAIYTKEVVSVIHEGLKANKDTRLTRDEIGDEIVSRGLAEFIPFYLNYLAYAVSGDNSLEVAEPSKKK